MNLVKEIMVPIEDYATISEDATLKEAIATLRASFHREGSIWHGHKSLVVLNSEEKLVGLLTLRNLLAATGIRELTEDVWIKAETWSWYFLNKIQNQTGVRVRDIMRPIELATVNINDEVLAAAYSLFTNKVNSMPVLDKGKVVGILRTIDVFLVIKDLL